MSRPARVVDVEHLGDFRLRLTFSDNLARELDFEAVLDGEVSRRARPQAGPSSRS